MGTKEKLLFRLFSRPHDFKWEDLVTLLCGYGFKMLKNKGSRHKFFHPDNKRKLSFHKPHPENTVKRYVIDQTIAVLKDMGIKP
jgi:predicted RNA binding protein YcfA (HicA-like mRNA interferase family)